MIITLLRALTLTPCSARGQAFTQCAGSAWRTLAARPVPSSQKLLVTGLCAVGTHHALMPSGDVLQAWLLALMAAPDEKLPAGAACQLVAALGTVKEYHVAVRSLPVASYFSYVFPIKMCVCVFFFFFFRGASRGIAHHSGHEATTSPAQ